MLEDKIKKIIKLSDELNNVFHLIDKDNANGDLLKNAAELIQLRDKSIRNLFTNNPTQELTEYSNLLSELLSQDKVLIQLASSIKAQMRRQIIQQKQKTKATQAYLNK